MSSNQSCPECGLQDYAFMVVCSDCGALLDAMTTAKQEAYFASLHENTKEALRVLVKVEKALYSGGVKDFPIVRGLLTEAAYRIAFGTSQSDAGDAQVAQFHLDKTKPQPFPTEA